MEEACIAAAEPVLRIAGGLQAARKERLGLEGSQAVSASDCQEMSLGSEIGARKQPPRSRVPQAGPGAVVDAAGA